jgi:hypothetical protein
MRMRENSHYALALGNSGPSPGPVKAPLHIRGHCLGQLSALR